MDDEALGVLQLSTALAMSQCHYTPIRTPFVGGRAVTRRLGSNGRRELENGQPFAEVNWEIHSENATQRGNCAVSCRSGDAVPANPPDSIGTCEQSVYCWSEATGTESTAESNQVERKNRRPGTNPS
jgi:hypothetical protein